MEKLRSLRLFYALWPDASTRIALQNLQRELPLTGRLVPPENLHVTLAFLGDQAQERLPLLQRILKEVALPAIRLELDRLGHFRGSRITWTGMRTPPDALMNMQANLVRTLRLAGISFDAAGRFVPHVTLARGSAPLPELAFEPICWENPTLVLVRSVIIPGGSRYEVLASR